MATATARAVEAPDIQPPPVEAAPLPSPSVSSTPGFVTVGTPKELAKLFAKMAAVLGDIERVAKNGENTQQSYRYTTAADLLDEVRPLLARHGIAFFPSVVASSQREGKTRNGSTKTITHVELQTAFCCTESGAMLISTWHGEAEDSGDKSYWKAYTGTLKYAHFQTWMVSTGDDPEEDQTNDPPPQQQNGRRSEPEQPRAEQATQKPEAKPERTEWHTRVLTTINERRKQLPDGLSCTVGKTQTGDLKKFIAENWDVIEGNVELAKKAAHAIDAALKALAKQKREAEAEAEKSESPEQRVDRLRGRYFALLKEKHGEIHDADRRAFQEKATGKASSSEWSAHDFEVAIKAVQAGTAGEFICPM